VNNLNPEGMLWIDMNKEGLAVSLKKGLERSRKKYSKTVVEIQVNPGFGTCPALFEGIPVSVVTDIPKLHIWFKFEEEET